MRKGQRCDVTYNINFFEDIDSEKKAYWLGFIAADGWVTYNPTKYKYSFGVTLQERDSELILSFMKDINCNNKIYTKTIKNRKYIGFTITNKKMVEDLVSLGIVQNKSKNLKTPKIKNELIHHFYRGLLDGDGHYKNKVRNGIQICGSFDILNDFKNFVENKFKLRKRKLIKHNSIYYYSLTGKSCKKVIDFLYLDASISLSRKKKTAMEISRYYENDRFFGVYFRKDRKKYSVKVKNKSYGCFDNEIEAAKKYNDIVKENNFNLCLNEI